MAEVSVGCELVSTGHSYRQGIETSGHERLPLGQRGRAAELVGLAVDGWRSQLKRLCMLA